LKLIGRRHNWKQVDLAVKNARKAGFSNLSLDLIYGLPSQSKNDWADTLAKAMALRPEHLSCYGLKLEPGTPMHTYAGSPLLPSDDDQADMYLYAVETLERYGYVQYEISNFALPGKESRHNLKYWRRQDYIGFGCSAHSCVGNLRYSNTVDVRQYISDVLGEKCIIGEQEHISRLEQAAEYLMLGLRTTRGISRREYLSIYRSSFDPLETTLNEFVKKGWARRDGERWCFTSTGFLLSIILIGVLLEAQTQQKFNANPWVREAFEAAGERVPLPRGDEMFNR
jgi:oxygen-independent coproporphyrinogen-3 oxidase